MTVDIPAYDAVQEIVTTDVKRWLRTRVLGHGLICFATDLYGEYLIDGNNCGARSFETALRACRGLRTDRVRGRLVVFGATPRRRE